MRDDRLRLQDIVDAIQRIERYSKQGRHAFDQNELIRVWAIHHLQMIGEAASAISESFRTAHPDIAWPQIVAMRNILIHEYFGVDPEEVWSAVENDLPSLKRAIQAALENLKS